MPDIFRRIPLLACALALALPALNGRLAADDEPTSPTRSVVLSAQTLLGEPIPDLELIVDAGGEKETIKTGKAGMASVTLPASATSGLLPVKPGGDQYKLAGIMAATSPGATRLIYFLELYPADPKEMTEEMRQAYVDRLPEILATERAAGEAIPGDAASPSALRLSALLNVYRGEDEPWGVRGTEPVAEEPAARSGDGKTEAPTPSIVAKLVDAFGEPVSRRVVELYELSDKDAKANVVRRGRTDPEGEIVFRNLAEGRFYRFFAPADGDNLFGRSPIVQLSGTEDYEVRPIVLRPRGQTISGLVFYGDSPLPRAQVIADGEDVPTLEARTDQFGYFELGPLPPAELDLTVTKPGDKKGVAVHTSVADEEVLIPYDILELPAKPGAEPVVE